MIERLRYALIAWWRDDTVSRQWLRHHDQRATRVEFHSVWKQWPVKKRINEAGQFNRQRLRKSA